MIVKGIELMQMIADGKIKDGTKIKIIGRFCGKSEYYFEYKGKFEIYDGNDKRYDEDKWTGCVSLYDLIHYSFEILEDKIDEIEEIEEIDTLYSMLDFTDIRFCKGEIDFNFKEIQDKINELVKVVNKLNKQDTITDANCMSD